MALSNTHLHHIRSALGHGGAPPERPLPRWRRAMREVRGAAARLITGDPNLYPTPPHPDRSDIRLTIPARITSSPLYQPPQRSGARYGSFGGRPIIGPRTPIHGGVLLSNEQRVGIVIDERYGQLDAVYHALITTGTGHPPLDTSEIALVKAVFVSVRSFLPLNRRGVTALMRENGYTADEKVALDVFITARVANPLHQVALAGYLLERLQRNARLDGSLLLDPTPQRPSLLYTSSRRGEVTFTPR